MESKILFRKIEVPEVTLKYLEELIKHGRECLELREYFRTVAIDLEDREEDEELFEAVGRAIDDMEKGADALLSLAQKCIAEYLADPGRDSPEDG